MQSCCLIGCESYKYVSKQKIGYFKFPFHDQQLLQKWLNQIRIPDWIPTDAHQICSTHFHIDDIDFTPRFPVLKNNAVPMIFPLKHFQHIYVNNAYSSSVTSTEIRQASKTSLSNHLKYSTDILSTTDNLSVLFDTVTKKLIPPNIKNSTKHSMKPLRIEESNKSSLNPYIFIVSRFDDEKLQLPLINQTIKITHPVLKIEIDKKITESYKNSSSSNSRNQLNGVYNKEIISDSLIEEVEIEDVSTSKIVVFKLNRSTEEIRVLKREKKKSKILLSD